MFHKLSKMVLTNREESGIIQARCKDTLKRHGTLFFV